MEHPVESFFYQIIKAISETNNLLHVASHSGNQLSQVTSQRLAVEETEDWEAYKLYYSSSQII